MFHFSLCSCAENVKKNPFDADLDSLIASFWLRL